MLCHKEVVGGQKTGMQQMKFARNADLRPAAMFSCDLIWGRSVSSAYSGGKSLWNGPTPVIHFTAIALLQRIAHVLVVGVSGNEGLPVMGPAK